MTASLAWARARHAALHMLACVCATFAWSAGAAGPDVTVITLIDTNNYGASAGIRGYSLGTVSCNIGTAPLNWCDRPSGCGLGTQEEDHPVIAQNLYRLKNGRMDQIGASWLKHGFESTNTSDGACGSCQAPPLGSDQLGVGCTDAYDSFLNGSRPLGRKSEVNPASGVFPFPPLASGNMSLPWHMRLAVAEADLSSALNPGARYFVEGHYVAADDAGAANGLNNASYREVSVHPTNFNLTLLATTVRERAAIQGWQAVDATVELFDVDIPGTTPLQRFHVARKVTEPTPGTWHYEYAVHNMNADRAAGRLTIEFAGATTFSNTGFHDVDAHSGEPYDTTNWPATATANALAWTVPAFPSAPEHANAIRWGTMYNFWFDASRPPAQITRHVLGLFKKGTPAEVEFAVIAEAPPFADGFED
jgi:hypothetical protein